MLRPVHIPPERVDDAILTVGPWINEFCEKHTIPRKSLDFNGKSFFLLCEEGFDHQVKGFFTCRQRRDSSGYYLHAEIYGGVGESVLGNIVNALAMSAGIPRWIVGPPRNVPYSEEIVHGKNTYRFELVPFEESYPYMEPLYREHYAEMKARLDAAGAPVGDYDPRLPEYCAASERGDLLTFCVFHNEDAVGYANIYLTNDMHNKELIATEDAIFVSKKHRNGVGSKLTKAILGYLEKRGVKRVIVSPVTDLRVEEIWARMGFKRLSTLMVFNFGDSQSVRIKPANPHNTGRKNDNQ